MRFVQIGEIVVVILMVSLSHTVLAISTKEKRAPVRKKLLQEQIDELRECAFQKQIDLLNKKHDALLKRYDDQQKKIALMQNILPRYVRAVENIKKTEISPLPLMLPEKDELSIPEDVNALARQLMKTAGHARLEASGDRNAFIAYFNLIDASDVIWANNVRSNKSVLQVWLHDHGDQLTREEFLRVIQVCEQCFVTYRNELKPDEPMDKYFMLLVNRELYRFFYTHHGNNEDLRTLLQQPDVSDNSLAWALIIATRMGAHKAPGVLLQLRDQLIGVYAAKLDKTIAQAHELTKPLYEQTKADTVRWLGMLKIAV